MSRKIQLTIKVDYLPRWGAFEGIRELIQNAKDAEIEFSAPMKVDHYNDTLRIENEGCTLPIKALLLGHTTKLHNSRLIGKFGEGLKLGVLALIRKGHEVKIRNGPEVWTPTVEHSELFDERVLTFRIESGRENRNRVRVEVKNISKLKWKDLRKKFLFIQKHKRIDTSAGGFLTDPRHRGKVFVRGIFVQTDPNLRFGYDLPDADLDRDRRMVEPWSLKSTTREILLKALEIDSSLLEPFMKMLLNPTTETDSIDAGWSLQSMSTDTAKLIGDKFCDRYGEHAVPVASLAESKDIEHLGKKGVVVSKPFQAVLSKTLGDTKTIKENLKKEVLRKFGWGDLTGTEKAALSAAIKRVSQVAEMSLNDVDVASFRSDNVLGQFSDDRILLARKILKDPALALQVLIHEVAHRNGDDGDKGHVERIEKLWTEVFRNETSP